MATRKHDDRRGGPAGRRIPRLRRMLEDYKKRQQKYPDNAYIAAEIAALSWAIEVVESVFPEHKDRVTNDTTPAVEHGRRETK